MTDPPIAEPDGDDNVTPEPGSKPGMPRWVRAFAIIAIILVLAAVVGFLTGQLGPGSDHGPGRHTGRAGGPALSSAIQPDPGAGAAEAAAAQGWMPSPPRQ